MIRYEEKCVFRFLDDDLKRHIIIILFLQLEFYRLSLQIGDNAFFYIFIQETLFVLINPRHLNLLSSQKARG